MSDQIHALITKIREKHSLVNEQLLTEQAKNTKFQEEIDELKSSLKVCKEELSSLEYKMEDAEKNKNGLSEQNITRSEGTMISDEQIDELVKEIDYCIGQLKK
tara:strand:- start:1387 stop:1695 length:309 start_codon:yes stop_codon:yes gene_type:complete